MEDALGMARLGFRFLSSDYFVSVQYLLTI
jgi:hypothetical protein